MDQKIIQSGYVIQLYQYARRYRYNNEGLLTLFDHALKRRKRRQVEEYTLEEEYLTFGDFDVLQVICVDSFRKYHDVSELAKDWFGKRQSVLLYDISSEEYPTRIYYDEADRVWKRTDKSDNEIKHKFFCLTMFSFTNEILEQTEDIQGLLYMLREKILSVIDRLNASGVCKIECEVFGTFNTSELGIVWLSDQYVDILQVADHIKHIKVYGALDSGDKNVMRSCPAFFTSFSTIAIKEDTDPKDVLGEALVQIAVHDLMDDHAQIQKFAETVARDKETGENGRILYSVGEYDLAIEVLAKRAISLIKKDGILSLGRHDSQNTQTFIKEPRLVLRNNIKLLHSENDTGGLKCKLEKMYEDGYLSLMWKRPFKGITLAFEWKELDESIDSPKEHEQSIRNADYFQAVRKKLKERVSPSAGAVDTLDLLYADYHSTISTVYSAMWVSDLHRQFKAVLHAIDLLLTSEDLEWSWDEYKDLTNAFKQQIYHLTQANRMFFEVPSCHLRATGQYDFLMHAYYGVVKKMIETIYLMQGIDKQSELIPLITVNTVPQVKTQLYFEIDNDGNRVINLDIPNSIIFDPQRGIWYLTHELFHYAVPSDRKKRNYNMAIFLLFLIFRKQFFHTFTAFISMRIDGTTDRGLEDAVKKLMGIQEAENNEIVEHIAAEFCKEINILLINYIIDHFDTDIVQYIYAKSDDLSMKYQMAIYLFADGNGSRSFYEKLFMELFRPSCVLLMKMAANMDKKLWKKMESRIKYCNRNQEYVRQFLQSDLTVRFFDSSRSNRHTTFAKSKWQALREACSDIAMVSLNSLNIEDYMLFCIQAWTDGNNDRSRVLEKMHLIEEEAEWFRYALVAEYFLTRSREGWCEYKNSLKTIFGDRVKKEFCKQYVWFYAGKDVKYPDAGRRKAVSRKIKEFYVYAEKWLDFFSECMQKFQQDLSILFDDILSKILSDYDIGSREEMLRGQKTAACDSYAARLEDIQKEFETRVYRPYMDLFLDMPDICAKDVSAAAIADFDAVYKRNRFMQDISVAHYFQKQSAFCVLGDLNQKVQMDAEKYRFAQTAKTSISIEQEEGSADTGEVKDLVDDDSVWEFHVHSLTELLFYIRYCFDKLNETAAQDIYMAGQRKKSTIWFRGHSSEKYLHVPTVMRNFKDSKILKYRTIQRFQQSNFEEFKFRADGAPEMPAGLHFTKSDYIAMMQHYGASTNFLDWTENAFTSLYLALKYYYQKELKPGDKEYRNVTLSIFHPGIYNHIRRNSMGAIRAQAEKIEWLSGHFKKVLSTEHELANLIPNLSIKENEEYFDMFLLGDAKAEKAVGQLDRNVFREYNKIYALDLQDLFMPMAILTSRLNPRIRTQCGCFVAYHLYTPPDMGAKGKDSFFDHISLEEIQKRKKDKGVFLYKITIDAECCKDVVNWLGSMGVSRENIFPELSEKGYYFE